MQCALDDYDDDVMMCIRVSNGRPVVVPCMGPRDGGEGVRLGMGWVGSWVHKFA